MPWVPSRQAQGGGRKAEARLPGMARLPKQKPVPAELELSEPIAEGESKLEACLLRDLRERGVPEPETGDGCLFALPRRWRFDMCWPALKLAIEVQGGTWGVKCRKCDGAGGECKACRGTGTVAGRHTGGIGFAKECEKRRAAALAGWCVLEYCAEDVRTKKAAKEIALVVERLFHREEAKRRSD